MENRMGAEAIQRAIYLVLPSLPSTGDMVHCLGERALFFFFICGRFLGGGAISSFKRTKDAI